MIQGLLPWHPHARARRLAALIKYSRTPPTPKRAQSRLLTPRRLSRLSGRQQARATAGTIPASRAVAQAATIRSYALVTHLFRT